MLFSSVYKKAIAKRIAREQKPVYVLRDSITHNEIARGTYAKMQALQSAFGVSYIETV